MIEKAPLKFKPYLKTVIWGGDKICNYKGIPSAGNNIGESWEISVVPGHESVVAEGKYKNRTLNDLIEEFGEELLGERVISKYGKKFPLLIKLIDANDNLSVQVHPNDTLAMERHQSLGKTEMWYVISTSEDAKIYAGFKIKSNPDDYIKRIKEGTFTDTLAIHDSHPDDVFFLPAGRVHAIGAGNLLAEIQESSDVTYRIYDYNRRDAQGNPRELHTELAKDAIDYEVYKNYKIPHIDETKEVAPLVECEHFVTHRIKVDTSLDLSFNPGSFTVLMCLRGKVSLKYDSGNGEIKEGETVLLPATLNRLTLYGKARLLTSQV